VREYEFTFVVQPEISDDGLQALHDKFDALLGRHDAIKLYYDDWGRRRLAYEIQKFQKGHYFVLYFLDEGKVVPELERMARLEDSILRFLTVQSSDRVDDIEERKTEAVALEEERKKKAAERAAREAEEAAERAAREEEAAAAAAAAEASGSEDDEGGGDREAASDAAGKSSGEGDGSDGAGRSADDAEERTE
jgi:small subunit ribosomal protein S6